MRTRNISKTVNFKYFVISVSSMKRKNYFVRYFLALLALTVAYDLFFGSYEAAQVFITGKIFGGLLTAFSVLFGVWVVSAFMFKYFFRKLFSFSYSDRCECHSCVEERGRQRIYDILQRDNKEFFSDETMEEFRNMEKKKKKSKKMRAAWTPERKKKHSEALQKYWRARKRRKKK